MSEAGIRSFVAIPLPAEIRSRVLETGRSLFGSLGGLSVTAKIENLHATLAFLGDIPLPALEGLASELSSSLARLQPFRMRVAGLGAFPSGRRARVLWAGLHDPAGELTRLAQVVREVCEGCGLTLESRPFSGHVTFARARRSPVDVSRVLSSSSDRDFGEVSVTEVHLYESKLGREGSTYTVRSRASLATA